LVRSVRWFQHKLRDIAPYTHIFNGPFPGLPGSAGTRKVKPIWILLKQETASGSGISHDSTPPIAVRRECRYTTALSSLRRVLHAAQRARLFTRHSTAVHGLNRANLTLAARVLGASAPLLGQLSLASLRGRLIEYQLRRRFSDAQRYS